MVVREAHDAPERELALALRQQVFCEEQGVSLAAERDGRDSDAVHVVAVEDGALIGTCRLLIDGSKARLGRMAVAASERRRGVGGAILREAEALARAGGADRVTLHAQIDARDLYARSGYAPRGELFLEEGIQHVTMEKTLA